MLSDKILQWITAVLCAVLSYMYGEFDGMLKALVFCMAIDYITDLIENIKTGSYRQKSDLRLTKQYFLSPFLFKEISQG